MAFARSVDVLRELCTALGLDPDRHHVTKIVVECAAKDVVRATVTRLVKKDEVGPLVEVVENIAWQPEADRG